MEVQYLTAATAGASIKRLIDEYAEFHWAVAWGTHNAIMSDFLKSSSKFRNVSFGVAFSQTGPDLIDNLVGVKNAYVVTKFEGGTFHPKIYCFRDGNRAAAIIGSANFTNGGLSKNCEAAILITGAASEQVFEDLFAFTKSSAALGKPVTSEFATAYRASCKRAARMPKPPRDPMADLNITNIAALSSRLVGMSWESYEKAIASSSLHNIDGSLELLQIAQEWFASQTSFANLSPSRRKAIAGIIGKLQKTDDQLNRDWGWFGSMKGAGDFANRIVENDRYLARAIDSIPNKGEVTRKHYERFAKLFIRAFENSDRVGGVPTATRLLAMKRPDTFLCISKPNLVAAAEELAFRKSTLTLDTYWEFIIEPIRVSEWYTSEKPVGSGGYLWENRVAMLDAIFYRP